MGTRRGYSDMPEIGDLVALREWLWERSEIQDSGCMIWQQKIDKSGYPCTYKASLVHRMVYRTAHNGIPAGLQVHHTCGNRLCVNPAHLSTVTQRANTAEMLERRSYQDRISALEDALHEAGVPLPVE